MKYPVLFSLFLALLGQAVAADISETLVTVNGDEYCSDWRFSIPGQQKGIGCNGELGEGEWSNGQCDVILLDGEYIFQIRSLYGHTKVTIDATEGFQAETTPMITTGMQGDDGFISFNLVDINIETNGYEGDLNFEAYRNNNTGACEKSPVVMPLGTTSNLVIGAVYLVQVRIGYDGVPYPSGTSGVTQKNPNTIELQTVDVLISPQNGGRWLINGVINADPSSGSNYLEGEQRVRLVRGGVFQILAHSARNADKVYSSYFKISEDCRAPSNSVYVRGAGLFNLTYECVPLSP